MLLDGGDRVLDDWGTGQLRSFTESHGGTTEFTWDGPLLRGVERSVSFAGEVQFSYGNDFLLATESVVGASTIAYGFDHDDLLIEAGEESITRDPVLGAVIGTTLGDVTSLVTYSSHAEVSALAYAHAGNGLYEIAFTRDALGRLLSKTETVGGVTTVESYTYDGAGRLDTVERDGLPAFDADYDDNGNRIALTTSNGTRTSYHDDQDRLIEDGDLDFVFNAAGELASRTDVVTSEVTGFVYHELGGLLEVTRPDGTDVGYTIDAAGRRIGKEIDGDVVAGWLYGQQLGPVAELDATGAIVSRFVYASRAHVPDYMEKGGVTYRLLTDHIGSVRLVVDVATGTVAQRLDYDPWGVVTHDTSPGFQPFGFAGGHYDHDTGLVRFGLRDYDPAAGRWTTKDPIGFDGGDSNLYAYVGGDPVNGIDPSGLFLFGAWDSSAQFVTSISDFSAGFGDTLSGVPFTNFSLSGAARRLLDVDDVVDKCSNGFLAGEVAGIAHQALNLHPKLPGWLLGRGFKNGGLLNRWDRLRFGWGWSGSGKEGSHVLRIALGTKPNVRHIDILAYPRSWWGGT
ncbi:MAG: RHS repeat-associated core domain-containing protein [Nannocystaceae bacterium]|nr:RHS repeat-associated core domain-containing protein [Nannocystaceae bacterium]